MRKIKCLSALLTLTFLFCVGTVDAQVKTLSANQSVEKVKAERKAAPNAKKATTTTAAKKKADKITPKKITPERFQGSTMTIQNGVLTMSAATTIKKMPLNTGSTTTAQAMPTQEAQVRTYKGKKYMVLDNSPIKKGRIQKMQAKSIPSDRQ